MRSLVGSRSLSAVPDPLDNPGKQPALLFGSNSVREMGEYRAADLRQVAAGAGWLFLRTNLRKATGLADVVDRVDAGLRLCGRRNLDTFCDRVRDADHLLPGGPSRPLGVVIVIEQLPAHVDCAAFLHVFRQAVVWWDEEQVPFHCFYSYGSADPFCDFVFRQALQKARRDARKQKPNTPKAQRRLGATARETPWFVRRVTGISGARVSVD
jgi:hypothetical protein